MLGRRPRAVTAALGLLALPLLAACAAPVHPSSPNDASAPEGSAAAVPSPGSSPGSSSADGSVLWAPRFGQARALVTNELAFRDPAAPGAHRSADWIVTSGSLFSDQGWGWSGVPDGASPDAASAHGTGSAVLRTVSAREDFGDVTVSVGLDVASFTTTPRTPAQSYDGVHLFLRYRDPDTLYAVSLCRRDGTTAIKRKEAGTHSVDGFYETLAAVNLTCPVGHWRDYRVSVRDEAGGVRLTLVADGHQVVSVLDDGQGGVAPLRGAGRVGVRGDNADFHFRDFTVTR